MKYLLLFCGRPEDLEAWQAMSEEERLQMRAITLTDNQAEQGLLHQRLSRPGLAEGHRP